MILGKTDIFNAFESGKWTPYRDGEIVNPRDLVIGPNSVDVTLSNQALVPVDNTVLDTHINAEHFIPHTIGGKLILASGAFVLLCTRERFDTSYPLAIGARLRIFTQLLHGRSTVARMGLMVHLVAGFGDYGFRGAFTMEVFNASRNTVILHPGDRIAQVSFEEVSCEELRCKNYKGLPVDGIYEGAYNGCDHYDCPIAPKLGKERF